MKTKICILILALSSISIFPQVGINTTTPSATLDVNGTMKVRDTPQVPALPGYQIMAVNQGTFQVAKVDPQVIIDAANSAVNTNTSVYAAKKTATITLLNLGIFPAGFQAVNFLQSERNVGNPALFSDVDNSYTIPTAGVYAIGYSFRLGTGLQASILTGGPGIGIVMTRAGVTTIIDSRPFSGLTIPLVLSLTISESSINSLYTFQAGDKISFGLTDSGVINAGLLGSSIGSFYIYKVSN